VNPKTLLLFDYDWDASGYARLAPAWPQESRGFDLFSFPSNARLAWFDLDRYTERLAALARRRGWRAVSSQHEQFGALAAALLAERMGWPGTPVHAILACQHKLHARRLLAEVAPEANPAHWAPLEARYGGPVPEGLDYPLFVKPVKAAFSVLARTVDSRAALHAHTRFGRRELWVIRRLVEPFERIAHARLPQAGSAHRMMVESPVRAAQYNLDGYVWNGRLHAVGFTDSIMYPGTQAFMRFDTPSLLSAAAQGQALSVARRFLRAAGFTHGLFNMEFFHDAASGQLTVIEFNPRMASQFSDLYRRTLGVDLHAMALHLAHGRDPALAPRAAPLGGAASSLVYRAFGPATLPPAPRPEQEAALRAAEPEALYFHFPQTPSSVQRDLKWLQSTRYGIIHLHGRDADDLRARGERASRLLGWPVPFESTDGVTP